MARPACRFYAAGKCRYGNDCRYAHEDEAATTLASHQRAAHADSDPTATASSTEDTLRRWKFAIPRDKRRSRPLGDQELCRFLENAISLVSSSTEHMQTVITTLATEEGVMRVREIVARKFDGLSDQKLAVVWQQLLLPYFKLLSHESVLQSVVVEVRHATLLNDLYGTDGEQGASVFRAAARSLNARPNVADCDVTISVLALMVTRNSSAKVNEPLKASAEKIVTLAGLNAVSRATERGLRTINVAFKIGLQLPNAGEHLNKRIVPAMAATFTTAQDLPGELSEYGARHDNDHEDIQFMQVLPTREEIESARVEYLPREEPSDWHRPGLSGLLDRHFRLVRKDTVGQLRDSAKFELQRLQNPEHNVMPEKTAARTHVYDNVGLNDFFFDDQHGLLLALSFDQPAFLRHKSVKDREEWWSDCRRLTGDSLVCLLSSGGDVTFLTIHVPSSQSTQKRTRHYRYTSYSNPHTAAILAKLTTSDADAVTTFLQGLLRDANVTRRLVEFPGVLLSSFAPTLHALQHMSETLDVPFADLLVSGSPGAHSHGPRYASQQGFRYQLRSLRAPPTGPTNDIDLDQDGGDDMATALLESSLDAAQQAAFQHALTNSMALIQGPPGTGKSYTGVRIIQALLENRVAGKLGPIVCVCYTNHALDQLLEHLLDAGVKQLVRIGSRSKSVRLAAVNIRSLAREHRFTRQEGYEYGKAKNRIDSTTREIVALLSRLNDVTSDPERAVMAFLDRSRPVEAAKMQDGSDDDGWTTVRRRQDMSPVQTWRYGGHEQHSELDRPLQEAEQVSLADLSRGERESLYQHWISSILGEIYQELEIQIRAHSEDKERIETLKGDLDLRILAQASVIGITTTGLARNLKHLRKLPSKVLVVEEAGEVLEAHLLTAMLPSLEHAILIGDHLQLRPKCQNHELSVDNPASSIALDISLFERLVKPRMQGSQGLQYVTLETQRRMHPSISRLVRNTLYPKLKDADAVQDLPSVVGMRHRLFWLDHSHSEDSKNDQIHSTSQTNKYEVDIIAALVNHLQRQGVYATSDIAVLTPYLGQLRQLRRKLGSFMGVILNDRDEADLVEEDDLNEAVKGSHPPQPAVTKGSLLEAVRLATVDNFQGEEAKVVIVSLVRSNDQHKCGFLRTSNRIGVLLSRAQHGMYIIGNSQTSGHVAMWSEVIEMFKQDNLIGHALELSCPRHPDAPLRVTEPDDFARISPEAGCDLLCEKQLPCGHSCPSKCHADSLHNDVYCLKDCTRPKKGCLHPCQLACGARCAEICQELVHCDIKFECDHHLAEISCWQFQDRGQIHCEVPMQRDVPGCNHKVFVPCSTSVNSSAFLCPATCSTALDCGHVCQRNCGTCSPRDEAGAVLATNHGKCKRICGRDFNTCSHSCPELCHDGESCPPCSAPCEVNCAHSRCAKLCREPCTPCTEEVCPSSCPHSACHMPCGAPCDWVPCSKRCEKRLECGHQCPSLCGEICPSAEYCQVCATDDIREIQVDMILMETYGETDLDKTPCLFLPCGHVFSVETLDGQMDIAAHYHLNQATEPSMPMAVKGDLLPLAYNKMKSCPNCRSSLRRVARYGRVVRRVHLDECTKKFITWSNQVYVGLAEALQRQQAHLLDDVDKAAITGEIRLTGLQGFPRAIRSGVIGRYKQIFALRIDILDFKRKVRKEEQPFQRVHDLVEARRRRLEADVPEFKFDSSILQTRAQLLIQALHLRCDLIIVNDLVTTWENMDARSRKSAGLSLKMDEMREQCDQLLHDATKTMNVLQQAEANIFWAQFAALQCIVEVTAEDADPSKTEDLKGEAEARLDQAEQLCLTYSGQTASITSEVDAVRQMLKGKLSDAEMRMVVTAMQNEFGSTGHWYRCVNGHPFTVGECGMPMEQTRCPQCGAAVGGHNHAAAEGVSRAADIERDFGNMHLE